jgi:FeS assembly protein SufD
VGSLSSTLPDAAGLSVESLDALIERFGAGAFPRAQRVAAFERFTSLPMPPKPGRNWKHDLAKIDLAKIVIARDAGASVDVAPVSSEEPGISFVQTDGVVAITRAPGIDDRVKVCELADAQREYAELFAQVQGRVHAFDADKFGSLTQAFQAGGAFVSVPDGVALDRPIEIAYVGTRCAIFPYTIVHVGKGSRVTIVERLVASADAGFMSGVTEIIAEPRSDVTYTVLQENDEKATTITSRSAIVRAEAILRFGFADFGSELAMNTLGVKLVEPGARIESSQVFSAIDEQHYDLKSQVEHVVGNTTSDTVVKSAAKDEAQARYLGNIRIDKAAHGSQASLRDDVLLLSKGARIDSIPALEIAANDVQAFHGATVGALDDEHVFYAMSRGFSREEAERMIALGFFEPAIARFPGDDVRAYVRKHLADTVKAK